MELGAGLNRVFDIGFKSREPSHIIDRLTSTYADMIYGDCYSMKSSIKDSLYLYLLVKFIDI